MQLRPQKLADDCRMEGGIPLNVLRRGGVGWAPRVRRRISNGFHGHRGGAGLLPDGEERGGGTLGGSGGEGWIGVPLMNAPPSNFRSIWTPSSSYFRVRRERPRARLKDLIPASPRSAALCERPMRRSNTSPFR